VPWATLIGVAIVALIIQLNKSRRPGWQNKPWLQAGGFLGAAILVSRFFRIPLATVLTTLPFLIEHLRESEARKGRGQPPMQQGMSREEAALILGVSPQAGEQEIMDAYRTLMRRHHPDRGGSDFLAAKINQARDILLGP
jgi:hypothetical protein